MAKVGSVKYFQGQIEARFTRLIQLCHPHNESICDCEACCGGLNRVEILDCCIVEDGRMGLDAVEDVAEPGSNVCRKGARGRFFQPCTWTRFACHCREPLVVNNDLWLVSAPDIEAHDLGVHSMCKA